MTGEEGAGEGRRTSDSIRGECRGVSTRRMGGVTAPPDASLGGCQGLRQHRRTAETRNKRRTEHHTRGSTSPRSQPQAPSPESSDVGAVCVRGVAATRRRSHAGGRAATALLCRWRETSVSKRQRRGIHDAPNTNTRGRPKDAVLAVHDSLRRRYRRCCRRCTATEPLGSSHSVGPACILRGGLCDVPLLPRLFADLAGSDVGLHSRFLGVNGRSC